MMKNKKAANPAKGLTAYNNRQTDSKPCYCHGQGTCITCAWWLRLRRRLDAWRRLRDSGVGQ